VFGTLPAVMMPIPDSDRVDSKTSRSSGSHLHSRTCRSSCSLPDSQLVGLASQSIRAVEIFRFRDEPREGQDVETAIGETDDA